MFIGTVILMGEKRNLQKMADVIRENLKTDVNVPEDDLPQYTGALGCAILGYLKLKQ